MAKKQRKTFGSRYISPLLPWGWGAVGSALLLGWAVFAFCSDYTEGWTRFSTYVFYVFFSPVLLLHYLLRIFFVFDESDMFLFFIMDCISGVLVAFILGMLVGAAVKIAQKLRRDKKRQPMRKNILSQRHGDTEK